MHWHNCKTETIIVETGILIVSFQSDCPIEVDGRAFDVKAGADIYLNPGMTMTIFEGQQSAHSMRSVEGAHYIEASTPHKVDSERLYLCDDWRPEF